MHVPDETSLELLAYQMRQLNENLQKLTSKIDEREERSEERHMAIALRIDRLEQSRKQARVVVGALAATVLSLVVAFIKAKLS